MYLLDTDVLIDVQKGHAAALAWFAGLPDPPSVPGFVVRELLQDAQNARQVREALRLVAPRCQWSGRRPPTASVP